MPGLIGLQVNVVFMRLAVTWLVDVICFCLSDLVKWTNNTINHKWMCDWPGYTSYISCIDGIHTRILHRQMKTGIASVTVVRIVKMKFRKILSTHARAHTLCFTQVYSVGCLRRSFIPRICLATCHRNWLSFVSVWTSTGTWVSVIGMYIVWWDQMRGSGKYDISSWHSHVSFSEIYCSAVDSNILEIITCFQSIDWIQLFV